MMDIEERWEKIEAGEIKICPDCGVHDTHAEWAVLRCQDCQDERNSTIPKTRQEALER